MDNNTRLQVPEGANNDTRLAQPLSNDPIQLNLDAVNQQLVKPSFLKALSPSRLPSQAASDTSLSPGDAPLEARSPGLHHTHSRLNLVNTAGLEELRLETILDEIPADVDLTAPLTLEPTNPDGEDTAATTNINVDAHISEHLDSRFVDAYRAYTTMASGAIQTFSHGHQDLVLAVDFNYFGTRMVSASSDQRLKVYDKKDDGWTLVESWRAHDAEIVDVKWNGPFMGELVGSIGDDGRFKLWQEDVTELPLSGRRFKLISGLVSPTHAPFMSLDFKNIMQETWLALITRDGRLIVYEPVDQSNLHEWTVLAEHWVCGNSPPERQEEVGFKVAFHKEKLPCWTAVMAGLDRRALSLAVAAMRTVHVYRTDKSKRFYLAAELKGSRQIIRDVAWANGSMRGYDVIATASKDGAIRIYELSTPRAHGSSTGGGTPSGQIENEQPAYSPRPSGPRRNAPSGIGAGLASASRAHETAREPEQVPGRVHQTPKLVDELTNHHGAVWRVAFSQMGDLLVSTGDDASIRTWKKAINGHWTEYAELDTVRNQ